MSRIWGRREDDINTALSERLQQRWRLAADLMPPSSIGWYVCIPKLNITVWHETKPFFWYVCCRDCGFPGSFCCPLMEYKVDGLFLVISDSCQAVRIGLRSCAPRHLANSSAVNWLRKEDATSQVVVAVAAGLLDRCHPLEVLSVSSCVSVQTSNLAIANKSCVSAAA